MPDAPLAANFSLSRSDAYRSLNPSTVDNFEAYPTPLQESKDKEWPEYASSNQNDHTKSFISYSIPQMPAQQPLDSEFIVHIVDPVKVSNVVGSHTEYKVIVKSSAQWFQVQQTIANRRYKDFLWIYQTLVDKYPGVIVPPIPDKHVLGMKRF